MKLLTPHCPECGELARGILETVQGRANLTIEPDGQAEYAGETKMFWDSQESHRNAQGEIMLLCHDGHEWWSATEGEPL